MNLYKIKFSHHYDNYSEQGMKALLIAENDEQVYEWIKTEPETTEGKIMTAWSDFEEYRPYNGVWLDGYKDVTNHGWYDEDGEPELFKPRMLRLKGDIDCDTIEFDCNHDLTLYGWELLKENVNQEDYTELIELGIVIVP